MEKKANWGAQIFLVLFPAAVGCLLGGYLLDVDSGTGDFPVTYPFVALVLAVMGALAPVLGIKKPLRSYRILSGVTRSPLSRQAVLVALFIAMLLVHWVLVLGGGQAFWLEIFTVVVGAAAVLAAGVTYALGSQPAWCHWSTLATLLGSMLALGVSLSMVVALGWRSEGTTEGTAATIDRVLVLVGVVLLGLAAWGWTTNLRKGGVRTADTRELLLAGGRGAFLASVALSVVVAGVTVAASFASAWLLIVTVLSLAAGLILMRRLLFWCAVPLNWKSEVNWSRPRSLARKEG